MSDDLPPHAIAVVGMAGRFPGAPSPAALFDNLCAGREGVTFFRPEDLDASIPPAVREAADYVAARGVIDEFDRFDAEFFGIVPIEAQVLDPQHRVLLEVAWAALEDSGHRPSDASLRIGVFAGAQWSSYQTHVVATRPDVVARFGAGNATLANEQDFLATRISYKLGLRGPSYTIGTACSTSLVAIAQAARALANGECDLALAGGVSIAVPVASGYRHEPGGMLSRDGHCRPFDAAASGTTFGDGAGIVVLRRLADALADGDRVRAVLRGYATNNDGADKVSFTAPSIAGQCDVLRAALAHAGVDPATIAYVETHGTATPMGDPIEFTALARAYRGREQDLPPCALGAVKSAVGHLVHAAGVAGFVTAVEAVERGVIPPVLHFGSPNPRLQLERTRFYVAREPRRWPMAGAPRRAGVSSFGVGGTNAHVVIESAPAVPARAAEPEQPRLLRLSARTEAALDRRVADLRAALRRLPEGVDLADVAFTLETGREAMRHRLGLVAGSLDDAVAGLAEPRRQRRGEAVAPRPVALQFPGHGVQRIAMAARLAAELPGLRRRLEQGLAFVREQGGGDVERVLFGGAGAGLLDDVHAAHPALFLCEFALAEALEDMGLVADAALGCSLGEFAAGAWAGVFTFEDALRAVMAGARAIEAIEPGGMFTVFCSEAEARAAAGADAALAAVWSDDAAALAGPAAVLEQVRGRCEQAGWRTVPLRADRAYHSPGMAAAASDLRQVIAGMSLQAPRRRLVSCALGREVGAAEATSPAHWADILVAPVRYRDAVAAIDGAGEHVLVEVGPGVTLTALALQRRGAAGAQPIAAQPIAALPGAGLDDTTVADLRAVLAHAWANGAELRTDARGRARRRVSLPTYPFERTRCWLERGAPPVPAATPVAEPASTRAPAPGLGSLATAVERIVAGASGAAVPADSSSHWSELGFDSLVVTQVAIGVRREFGVELGVRDLLERCTSPRALRDWLASAAPAREPATPPSAAPTPAPAAPPAAPAARPRPNPGARIERAVSARHATTPAQREYLARFCADYAARTQRSKQFAAAHRRELADPRTVTGFHPRWKEIVYPIVTERSRGARLWDLDGNEYVDLLNGFGSVLFGHSPDFVTAAVQEQLARGIEVGPQSPLAGEVAKRFCALTGNERVAFANTGSEAVAGALRIARTVTGRDKVVMFEGSYHGIFDEVVARAGPDGRTMPASPGIPSAHVGEVVVLPYAAPSSLQAIERLAPQLAAVLVEPVQGRHPDLQPAEFLRQLRQVCSASGTALILDEVVTGFRAHPGGIQALWGVAADIALYGKVVAGGHPMGLIAGRSRFLDALDGGPWQFGDASLPEAGVTFFAGTFVRHPVALAAARAVLVRLAEEGPALQERLTLRTQAMVARLNAILRETGAGLAVETCHSTFFTVARPDEAWSSLLFASLRHRGFHLWEQFPCFLTTSHTDDDVDRFVAAFAAAVHELQQHGFLSPREASQPAPQPASQPGAPVAPIPGARLGRRPDGSLAWFAPDAARPGAWREVADARVE